MTLSVQCIHWHVTHAKGGFNAHRPVFNKAFPVLGSKHLCLSILFKPMPINTPLCIFTARRDELAYFTSKTSMQPCILHTTACAAGETSCPHLCSSMPLLMLHCVCKSLVVDVNAHAALHMHAIAHAGHCSCMPVLQVLMLHRKQQCPPLQVKRPPTQQKPKAACLPLPLPTLT